MFRLYRKYRSAMIGVPADAEGRRAKRLSVPESEPRGQSRGMFRSRLSPQVRSVTLEQSLQKGRTWQCFGLVRFGGVKRQDLTIDLMEIQFMPMPDFTGLPSGVRQQLRAKTLALMSDLNVEAWIDERSDQILVDFLKFAEALGLERAEAEDEFRQDGLIRDLRSVPAGRLRPMQ